MNVSVFGMLPFSQLIKEGFKKLEHKISIENPELIYANDPRGFNEAMLLKKKYPNAYMILNMLDIPWHFPNIENQFKTMIKRFFTKSNNVTTISNKVKKDLEKFFDSNIHEKIKVIYNPIQNVNYDKKN